MDIFCNKCGKSLHPLTEKDKTTALNYCTCFQNSYKLIGWICPVCGAGVSPFATICSCAHNNYEYKIT